MSQIADNKRIAKNATLLTIRMIIVTLIGLYTSRVVLSVLGVVDYGIYGVVGGIVTMLGFLNASMSGATSRFLTYEMGKGDNQRLQKTFSSAVIAHLIIALLVVIVAETGGVWFLNAKMQIPEERMYAANWVLQFSILTSAVSIMQTPYNALIIAHERMGIYAYLEMLNAILKLLVVYLLSVVSVDKLILYAALLCSISVLIVLIYRVYCIKLFKESHFSLGWNPDIIKPMLKFTGLDLYGNMSVAVGNQGRSFLINIFYGVIYNAAVSIALTVQGVIMGLSGSIIQAFRPQIIKQYAGSDIHTMQNSMSNASKFSILALSLFIIPCYINADCVLKLWLGQVPEYAPEFLRILLIIMLFNVYNSICNIAIHATGNIKYISLITGSIYLFNPLIVWILFKLHYSAMWAYYILGISYLLAIALAYYIIHKLITTFSIRQYVVLAMRLFLVVFCSLYLSCLVCEYIHYELVRLMFSVILNAIILTLLSWFVVLDGENKQSVVDCMVKLSQKLSGH
jgi:O-antigen/teichoic acid export membrane protein